MASYSIYSDIFQLPFHANKDFRASAFVNPEMNQGMLRNCARNSESGMSGDLSDARPNLTAQNHPVLDISAAV